MRILNFLNLNACFSIGLTALFPSNNASAYCSILTNLSNKIAAEAYQTNITKTLSTVARQYRVPIVFRETTHAAEALQQKGLPTRPMRIKNKSSSLPGLEGYIPCEARAGKYGERLRSLMKSLGPVGVIGNNKHLTTKCPVCDLEAKITVENTLMKDLLEETSSDGKHPFTRVPITRNIDGVSEVVVYLNEAFDRTEWAPYQHDLPKNTAWVLGNADRNPITSDTDLVLIGQPKSSDGKYEIIFDEEFGFRTPFGELIRTEINRYWQLYSENTNIIIDHGDEANFGLNPIDEIYFAYTHEGRLSRFNLKRSNPDRAEELIRYARWLKAESAFADIFVPNESLQKAREKYLEFTYGMHLDYQSITEDYNEIKKILGPLAKTPSAEN